MVLVLIAGLTVLIQFVRSQAENGTPVECSEYFSNKGCRNCTKYPSGAMTCVGCGSQLFYNQSVQECQNCLSGCRNCTNLATCEDCLIGHFRTAANESQQALGYKHTCKPCQISNCLSCTDETTCYFCTVGYTLDPEKPGTCKYRVDEWVANAKNTAWIVMIVLFVICLAIIGGVVGWFYWEKKKEAEYLQAQERAKKNRELNRLPPNLEEEEHGSMTDRANRRTLPVDASSNQTNHPKLSKKTDSDYDAFANKPKTSTFEVQREQNLNESSKIKTLDKIDDQEEL